MAKNQDSFDMDKWSKGKKEKAEKPIKEKKEKEASFDMDDSGFFSMDKHTKKEKKEKTKKEKPLKEDNDTSFAVESKGKFDIKNAFKAKGKDGKSKEVKLDESGEFNALEGKSKKKVNTRLIIIVSAIAAVLIVAAIVAFAFVIPAVDAHNMEVTSIEIVNKPYYLDFVVGEYPNYDGLVLTATRRNGETFTVTAAECTITGFNSDQAIESCIIKVEYAGCSDYYSVRIVEEIKPAPVLERIYLSPMPKTEYKVGEWLNVDGAYIVCEYTDGSTSSVHLLRTDVHGWDEAYYAGPGTYTLTVKYQDRQTGKFLTTTYDITITE